MNVGDKFHDSPTWSVTLAADMRLRRSSTWIVLLGAPKSLEVTSEVTCI